MWKIVNGNLIHVSDESRVKFRTSISKSVLEELKVLAEENDTHVNYLLENGISTVLSSGFITYNKSLRPKDRIQYKTTYDKSLLEELREFAKKNKLYINDVIEYSIQFIDLENIKDRTYRSRVEREI